MTPKCEHTESYVASSLQVRCVRCGHQVSSANHLRDLPKLVPLLSDKELATLLAAVASERNARITNLLARP